MKLGLAFQLLDIAVLADRRQQALDDQSRGGAIAKLWASQKHLGGSPDGNASIEEERPEGLGGVAFVVWIHGCIVADFLRSSEDLADSDPGGWVFLPFIRVGLPDLGYDGLVGPLRASWSLLCAIGMAGALASCHPSRTTAPPGPLTVSTLRLYAIANLAGALEPCGCQKDMRGGLDHAAQLLANERSEVDQTLLVAAGPTFYLQPSRALEGWQQAAWKAEAVALSLRDIGLAGWSPGANDFGQPLSIGRLSELSGAPWIAANLGGAGAETSIIVERGLVRIGITGVSLPISPDGIGPRQSLAEAAERLSEALDSLRRRGAQLLVALFSLPRGSALRLLEQVPGFHVAIVGKPYQIGDANDSGAPPAMVEKTLVVQPGNLIQSLAAIDFRLVDDDWEFEDAGGLSVSTERAHLDRRIAELAKRITAWESSGASPADVARRREDLEQLRRERAHLDIGGAAVKGSSFRYSQREVRESAGTDRAVGNRILDYYHRVNEHNRVALADRRPRPLEPGESGYAGGASCVPCHRAADAFWQQTRHANAYATLVERHANYNLECVGCHVTGYEQPGGSTVVHATGLENVQCEVCHGPGALHNAKPGDPDLITLTPEKTLCASRCHHPPHVADDWSVEQAWAEQIGPGHGEPLPEPEDPNGNQPMSPEEALQLLAE